MPAILPVLGLMWNREEDYLTLDIKSQEEFIFMSKRHMLSIVAQVFDPLGFTAPALLLPKLLVQKSRHEAKAFEVETATLPVARVQGSEVFKTTGVDLAGPLIIRDGQKIWIVIYTCAVYRCVSLDVITGLSTADSHETFLNSLERFVANYGRPNTVYSDNGTNFIGAKNIFDKLDWEEIAKISQVKKLQWILNCEAAPWWGGFRERLIRSVKGLMKRMIGKSKLSFDELRTCIASVAAIINDRPLTTINEDGNDLVPLSIHVFKT
ncbi:uncharacterized protein LOC124164994 [Ischnura elegans]|uniref:uncharacterized protein LOC124164994 n=1 Tax=Ischnura elegans TaxID=197161 RepID=UPI001ED8BA17|nr:uncharacterized protein LOC124164994 [Ischnura elegans]